MYSVPLRPANGSGSRCGDIWLALDCATAGKEVCAVWGGVQDVFEGAVIVGRGLRRVGGMVEEVICLNEASAR